MKPLNYAILKYMTTAGEVTTEQVMSALEGEYSSFKAFNKKDVLTALMTAEVNGLIEESRYDIDDKGEIRMYFQAHPEGIDTINKYIRD